MTNCFPNSKTWGSHLSEDSEVEFRKPVYLRKVFSPIPVQAKVNSIMWTSAPSTGTAPQDQIKSVLSTHFFFFKQSALGIDRCYCYCKVKLHSHLTKMCLIKKQKNGYLELCQLLMKKKLWAQGNPSPLHTKSPQKQTPLKEPQAFWAGDAPHESHRVRGWRGAGGRICHVGSRHSLLFPSEPNLWNLERKGSSALQHFKYPYSIFI